MIHHEGHILQQRPAAIYIAGPMRSKPAFNYPAFMAAEELLGNWGYGPIYNPARMDLESAEGAPKLDMTFEEQRAHASSAAARVYARRDLLCILDHLDPAKGAAIALLPDWETSTGARAEVAVARWVGLPFILLNGAKSPKGLPVTL